MYALITRSLVPILLGTIAAEFDRLTTLTLKFRSAAESYQASRLSEMQSSSSTANIVPVPVTSSVSASTQLRRPSHGLDPWPDTLSDEAFLIHSRRRIFFQLQRFRVAAAAADFTCTATIAHVLDASSSSTATIVPDPVTYARRPHSVPVVGFLFGAYTLWM